MTKTYEAHCQHANGDRDVFDGLRKSQAIWRYNWFARQLLNNPRSTIMSYGWRASI